MRLANKLMKPIESYMKDGTPMYRATVVDEPVAIKTLTEMWNGEGNVRLQLPDYI